MSNWLKINKDRSVDDLSSEYDICQKVEFKLTENRKKKVVEFLKDRTNEHLKLQGSINAKRATEKNVGFISIPIAFLYLPSYYLRIFSRIVLLSDRVPGKKIGRCFLKLTEFYFAISPLDRIKFKEVFMFLINNGVITVRGEEIRVNPPFAYGVFSFDFRTLSLIEETYNRFHNREFSSNNTTTFVTDFDKI